MNIADEAINITEFVGSAAGLALKIGGPALPIIEFFAGFVPALAPAIKIINVATPILTKIVAASPVVQNIIKQGKPTIDALQAASPGLIEQLKALYAVTVNNDPARPEAAKKAEEVTDKELEGFVGSLFERSFFLPQDPRFERTIVS